MTFPLKPYESTVYRIVEQALRNSLAHGKASKFDVHKYSSHGELRLGITNNGHPYEGYSSSQGHGFAVIDAWVSKFNGAWERTSFLDNSFPRGISNWL